MRQRSLLGLGRMTPLQIMLAVATALVSLAIVALLLVAVRSNADARLAVESGYVITDLARIQRGISRLQVATDRCLTNPDEGLDDIDTELALLSNQLRMASGEAAYDPVLSAGLGRARVVLVEYNSMLSDLKREPTSSRCVEAKDPMTDQLLHLEKETQALYNQRETLFFTHMSRSLQNQRTSQIILLGMGTLLMVFGVALAASLKRSVGYEFDRAYSMLEALFQADEEIHRHLDPDAVLGAVVDVAVDILGAQKSILATVDNDQWQLVPHAQRGFDRANLESLRIAPDQGRVGQAILSNGPVMVENAREDPLVVRELISAEEIGAMMHVPIIVAQEPYAVLTICYPMPRTFDDDDRRLVRALAQRAASAIENARLYEQIEEAATQEERQRLARELHDAVTQTLFSASLIAEVLPRIWDRSPKMARDRLEELRELTRGALAEMRTLLLELRPQALEEANLGELLQQLGEAYIGRSRIPVDFHLGGESHCQPPTEIKLAVYRIAQESLNNVAKHSRAGHVNVSLNCVPDGLMLVVEDDGQGFDIAAVPPNHLGLGIIRERSDGIGAELNIRSVIGKGTRIELVWTKPEE